VGIRIFEPVVVTDPNDDVTRSWFDTLLGVTPHLTYALSS